MQCFIVALSQTQAVESTKRHLQEKHFEVKLHGLIILVYTMHAIALTLLQDIIINKKLKIDEVYICNFISYQLNY